MNNPIAVCVDRNPFSSLDELVAAIAQVGFARIEWFEMNDAAPWSAPSISLKIRALMKKHGLTPQYHAPYEPPFDLSWADGKLRSPREIAAVITESLDRAERLEAKLVTAHLGSCPTSQDRAAALQNAIEGISLAIPELDRRDMFLSLENHTQAIIQSSLGDQPEDFDLLLRKLSHKNIGMTFDVGHAHINGHIAEFLSRPLGRLFNLHLHDNIGQEDQHLPMGEGTIRWDKVLSRLAEVRYAGPLTFEFFAPAEAYLRAMQMVRVQKEF